MIAPNISLSTEFFGEKTALITKSGWGKSYAARVIVEEGLDKGHTFVIIDPQNAYLNLPGFDYVDARDVKDAKAFGVLISQSNKNVVVSMRRMTVDEQNEFMLTFLKEYRKTRRRGIQTMIIDEIHKYAPQGTKTKSKSEIMGMFQEDRSDGQGVIAISQRPARMDKTILAQVNNIALGRVEAKADKDAVKNYLPEKDDIEKVPTFDKGQFFLLGFGLPTATIAQFRKAKTQHSGDSPKNLLSEDNTFYQSNVKNIVRKTKHMADNIPTSNEPVAKIIPSKAGFMSLMGLGVKIGVGGAVTGVIAGYATKYVPASPIPYVSTRTLASTVSTVGLYSLYRMTPERFGKAKEVAKFAAAGSAAFWAGSVIWDVLTVTGLTKYVPSPLAAAVALATGAAPMMVASKQGGVDTDTDFQ